MRRHIREGTFESNLKMFEAHFNPKKREIATFTRFTTKARMLPVQCASSNSYVPPSMGAVAVRLMDRGGGLHIDISLVIMKVMSNRI